MTETYPSIAQAVYEPPQTTYETAILQTWCCNCEKWIDGTGITYKTHCPTCGRYWDDARRKPKGDLQDVPGKCLHYTRFDRFRRDVRDACAWLGRLL